MAPTSERILLVESDPEISQVIARQALRPLGYDVTVMTQAGAAIEAALTDPPDLIIANLNLPDLGGKDVLAAISAQGVTAPLVVIAEKGRNGAPSRHSDWGPRMPSCGRPGTPRSCAWWSVHSSRRAPGASGDSCIRSGGGPG